jgi:hypothetical protein
VSDAPRRMNDAVRSSMYLHYATRMAAAVRAALLSPNSPDVLSLRPSPLSPHPRTLLMARGRQENRPSAVRSAL